MDNSQISRNLLNINTVKQEHGSSFEKSIILIFKGLIPIILLISGIILLFLRYSFWSIFFGLPLITFGAVFSVYTYNDFISKTITPLNKETIPCKVCGKITPLIPGLAAEKTMCSSCFRKGKWV